MTKNTRTVVFSRTDPAFNRFVAGANFSGVYWMWYGDVLLKIGRSESPTTSVGQRVRMHVCNPNTWRWVTFMEAVRGRKGRVEFGECSFPEVRTVETAAIRSERPLWEQVKRETAGEVDSPKARAALRRRVEKALDAEDARRAGS
jgi:hypothetical protein